MKVGFVNLRNEVGHVFALGMNFHFIQFVSVELITDQARRLSIEIITCIRTVTRSIILCHAVSW